MASPAMSVAIVVEREGVDDVVLDAPPRCTVAALRQAVVEGLQLDGFTEWELRDAATAGLLGEDDLVVEVAADSRVVVRPSRRHIAGERLKAMGHWPLDGGAFRDAVQAQQTDVVALMVDAEELPRRVIAETLHAACKGGFINMATTLVAAGVPMTIPDAAGRGALSTAILAGRDDLCLEVLAAAAAGTAAVDINHTDAMDRTALHYAAKGGLVRVCAVLLDLGVNVDAQDEDRATALVRAVRAGAGAVAELLIARGCDVNAADAEGGCALLYAVEAGMTDVCLALLDRTARVNVADAVGKTPLIIAAAEGHHDVCMRLIDLGADVSAVDHYSWTPLLHATRRGQSGLCTALLEKRADIHAADACGRTPLIHAAQQRLESVALELVRRGADPHTKDMYGQTALLSATENGLERLCLVLLERDVDVDAKDATGTTALVHACNTGIAEKVCSTLRRRQSLLT